MRIFCLFPILFPILAGLALLLSKLDDARKRERYVVFILLVSLAATLGVFYLSSGGPWTLVAFSSRLALALKVDGLTKVFGTMAAVLWVPATFYAFEYMSHEHNQTRFFAFYLMSYGVTMGVAMAANPVTLYFFYECLTLATLPIVMHEMDGRARYAGKMYILYSMGGAGLAFAAVIFLMVYSTGSAEFVMGGFLNAGMIAGCMGLVQLIYLLGFFGFAVKAAIFPLHGWLPAASVAPTPVTALLHAVAVVKAGVFAAIRLSYYSFGAEVLTGGWAQKIILACAIFTVLYGSARALRMPHLKRRLAYSTISNLSYTLIGVALLSPVGLAAALLHMLVHAVCKITLFFCAGSILVQTGDEYVYQLRGYSRRMPIVFWTFLICSLGLMGIPPLAGFSSKWVLLTAAFADGSVLALCAAGALIVSAVLTALYLISVAMTACQPPALGAPTDRCDPGKHMTVPLIGLCGAFLALSVFAGPILQYLLAL
ncbi:MAG: proton-conducting transporter membrane subunit [Oscillospiraceae bacterium]|nr:proton-conducting transporter membrane subunit [Oscillospiraceae bacterium]